MQTILADLMQLKSKPWTLLLTVIVLTAPSLFSAGYQWRKLNEQEEKIRAVETLAIRNEVMLNDIVWIRKALDDNRADHAEIKKELSNIVLEIKHAR